MAVLGFWKQTLAERYGLAIKQQNGQPAHLIVLEMSEETLGMCTSALKRGQVTVRVDLLVTVKKLWTTMYRGSLLVKVASNGEMQL